jgi:glycosyltransferase involved in cell wall biosynthesis
MTVVSAIVCTHLPERAHLLAAAVASLLEQSRPPDEVLVVVDGDDALAEAVRAGLPAGVGVFARGQRDGLSMARNDGVAHTRGDVLLFLDDDAVADPRWVGSLLGALTDSDVLGASGLSLPRWESTAPRWLPEEFLWTLGCTYRGQDLRRRPMRNVYGGCAALRREIFTEVGGFDDQLGYRPGSSGGGEEAELCLRAVQHWPDRHFLFEPAALISHFAPDDRATPRYLIKRAWSEGRVKARVARQGNQALADERSFAWSLPRAVLRELGALLRGDLHAAARSGMIIALSTAVLLGLTVGSAQERITSHP